MFTIRKLDKIKLELYGSIGKLLRRYGKVELPDNDLNSESATGHRVFRPRP
jgi:hypothetical protein